MPNRVEILLQKFAQSIGLPFRDLLPESKIMEVLEAEKIEVRTRLFNPIVTIWAFLSQVLDTDKSLQNAVSRVKALLAQAGTLSHQLIREDTVKQEFDCQRDSSTDCWVKLPKDSKTKPSHKTQW